MFKLLYHDLREAKLQWISVGIMGVIPSFIVMIGLTLISLANHPQGKLFSQYGGGIIGFSMLPIIPIMLSVSNLIYLKRSPAYSLWSLIGFTPLQIRKIFLFQICLVGLLSSIIGSTISLAFLPFLLSSLGITYLALESGIILQHIMITAALVCSLLLLGSLRASRNASQSSPISLLLKLDNTKRSFTISRACFLLGGLIILVILCVESSKRTTQAITPAFFIPLCLTFCFSISAPLVFPCIHSLVSNFFNRLTLPAVAIANARHSLMSSITQELPIYIIYSIISGIYSTLNQLSYYYADLGKLGNFELPFLAIIIMIVCPVIICITGILSTIVLSLDINNFNSVNLLVAGFTKIELLYVAICEAIAHSINSLLLGVTTVIISNIILSIILRLPPFIGVDISRGIPAIFLCGSILALFKIASILLLKNEKILALLNNRSI